MEKFNLYQHNEFIGTGNSKMLKHFTDAEIKEFYRRVGIQIDMRRDI